MKLKILAAMRAKGYSDNDEANRTLYAQVPRAAEKFETEQATASVTPPAPARESLILRRLEAIFHLLVLLFPLQLLFQTWLAQCRYCFSSLA